MISVLRRKLRDLLVNSWRNMLRFSCSSRQWRNVGSVEEFCFFFPWILFRSCCIVVVCEPGEVCVCGESLLTSCDEEIELASRAVAPADFMFARSWAVWGCLSGREKRNEEAGRRKIIVEGNWVKCWTNCWFRAIRTSYFQFLHYYVPIFWCWKRSWRENIY